MIFPESVPYAREADDLRNDGILSSAVPKEYININTAIGSESKMLTRQNTSLNREELVSTRHPPKSMIKDIHDRFE